MEIGAIAELIDNALDARATRLDITLRSVRPISPMVGVQSFKN